MKIRKVVVVYKKSSYDVYARERRSKWILSLLEKGHVTTRRLVQGHEIHKETMAVVRRTLRERGIQATFVYRAHPFSERGVDLAITVGGDGTFIEASHSLVRCPVLGVNSNPIDSVGVLCGATARTLGTTLDRIEAGKIKPVEATRLRVKLGKKVLPVPVLNDVLIAHKNPAATSRYIIRLHGKEEVHKSSGIWAAPATGSTAAIRGAGGRWMPIGSRNFQYRVREIYQPDGQRYRLFGGVVHPRQKLIVLSKMRAGHLYVDGPHLVYPFPLGERAEITTSSPRLKVFAFDDRRRERVWK